MPKTKPALIQVPKMNFIMVDGAGDPNTSEEYKQALELLYGLSYSIKMSKMGGNAPEGYFEYVVPPLEGLWWTEGLPFDGVNVKDKSKFLWTSMIRQPEFVSEDVFEQAKAELAKKKPHLDLSRARFAVWEEGLCAQVMHKGPYDDEPATIEKLDSFIEDSGLVCDISEKRQHHEIYLSDPRKAAPEKLKTVIRHPVRKGE
ncbi:GyrI-like domain-containing protein [Anaerovorax odorimutans]|uniref:GyrI-like domain-containing protein n=2 Tax=Anaerovorax odorimutans TaxID=109327 RepID=A0ABT1RP20_9FIRM|nr:GyrI-like domain-containing protein [Anaerovorax odorimutans]MCQ4636909.1 GyrI-like domain-containing protein [Anaerovorax odorimutans]